VSLRIYPVVFILVVALIGVIGCTPEPSGPTPEPTYVRFVSVDPATSEVLTAGSLVQASAQVFADHKHNSADLALYVQTAPGEVVTEPVFKAIQAGPGQYTLKQTFTVPTDAGKVYLIAALYQQGEETSNVTSVTSWDVKR
jgi:hypothetical protein